jgi:ribosomal-protein-alanine N-acetyltransferase
MSILATRFQLQPMDQADVMEVGRVERRCFESPWPSSAYRRELRNTHQNYYVVLRAQPDEYHQEIDGNRFPPAGNRLTEGLWSRLPIRHLPRRSEFATDGPHIAGFAGMWSVYDEAHITTIGVDPHYRGRGFGELLLTSLFDEAIRRGANWLTLEVRVSNHVAQRLYSKYGLEIRGKRSRYYSDNGEDAYVMWSRSLRDADYLADIGDLRIELENRLGPDVEVPSPAWLPDNDFGRY